MALLDGDNGFGHLVMHEAARLALEKARTFAAWAGSARGTNHVGPGTGRTDAGLGPCPTPAEHGNNDHLPMSLDRPAWGATT